MHSNISPFLFNDSSFFEDSFNVSSFFKDAIDPKVNTKNEPIDFIYNTSEPNSSETTNDDNPLEEKIWEPEPGVNESTPIESLFFDDSNFDLTAPARKVQKIKYISVLEELAKTKEFVKRKDLLTDPSFSIVIRKLITKKFIEKGNDETVRITELGLKYFDKFKSKNIYREPFGLLSLTILEKLAENKEYIPRKIISQISKSANQAVSKYVNKGFIKQLGDEIRITPSGLDHYSKLKNKIASPIPQKQKRPLFEDKQDDVVDRPKKKQKIDQESRKTKRAIKAIVLEDHNTDPIVIDDSTGIIKMEDTVGHQSTKISGIYVLMGENSSLREAKSLTPFAQEILSHLAEIKQEISLSQLRSKFANSWSFASKNILHLKGLGCIKRKGETIQITPKGFYILHQLNYENHQ